MHGGFYFLQSKYLAQTPLDKKIHKSDFCFSRRIERLKASIYLKEVEYGFG